MDNPTKGDSVLEEIIFALGVFAFGLSALYLISIFRAQILRGWKRGMAKLWGVGAPERVLAKRIKLFILIGIVLIIFNKLILSRYGLPNFELIIPTLVVIGCISLSCGDDKFGRYLTRYFVVIALLSILLLDVAGWGLHPIYAFTWLGFLICWMFAMRMKISPFGRFRSVLYRAMFTGAVAILMFDVFTAFGAWMLWYPRSLAGLGLAYLAQAPFTLYHLTSLVFVPPLVGLGKALLKVPIAAPVAVRVRARVERTTWR
ncbi:hypothetical protein ES706_00266 [subsurface metagenome]|nr:hypothetical protein [Hadesarchaea archaeon]